MEEAELNGKTMLVVDDEVDLRDILASELEFMGAKVYQAGNITAAKEVFKNNPIDLIVSDIRMPGGTGIDLLDFVKKLNPAKPPIVLITGFADITLEDAYHKGAEALLNKPFKLDDLIKVVAHNILPIEERFIDGTVRASKKLQMSYDEDVWGLMDKGDFLIGRGGISLRTEFNKKIGVGDIVNFDLQFNDIHLQGDAICRWTRTIDNDHKINHGLEFLNLHPETLEFLLDYWKKDTLIAYIPTL